MQNNSLKALVIPPQWFCEKKVECENERVYPGYKLLGVSLIIRQLRGLQDSGVEEVEYYLPEKYSYLETQCRADKRISLKVNFTTYTSLMEAPSWYEKISPDSDWLLLRQDLIAPSKYWKEMLSKSEGKDSLLDAGSIHQRLNEENSAYYKSDAIKELGKSFNLEDLRKLNASAESRITFENSWRTTACGGDNLKFAERKLLNDLRKPIDGIISRTINRNISIPISRLLSHTSVTPNMASGSTVVITIFGVWAIAQGGYWMTLLGAFLYQFLSIIDGVDGELARLKFQFSKYGEWFDTIADDICNFLLFATITYSVWQSGENPTLVWFGLFTLLNYMFITPLMYSYIIKYTDSGDVMSIDFEFNKSDSLGDDRWYIRLLAKLKFMVKRDFFIFTCFMMAVFGVLHYLLYLSAVFSLGILITVATQHIMKMIETKS